ncbi:MAG: CDP-alcohol phosphatidyltransferase family protein [Lentisphaerota bacterium]
MTTKSSMTLANRITIARILGVPFFIMMLVYYTTSLSAGQPQEIYRYMALLLFVLVALTDAVDGYFARSRNEVTDLGRVLDPMADKALLLSSLLFLTKPSIPGLYPHIPIWFTVLVISRDAVLVLGYMVIHHFTGKVKVQPRIAGKAATVFTMMAIMCVLARGSQVLFFVLVWIATLFVLISWLLYLLDGIRQLEKHAGVVSPQVPALDTRGPATEPPPPRQGT